MCDSGATQRSWPTDAAAQAPGSGLRLLWGMPQPSERAEAVHEDIEIAIPFGDAAVEIDYRTPTGRLLHASVTGHHVSIIPAGQPHTVHWQRSAELIVLFIAPQRVNDAASSLGFEYRPEILERYAALDPFIRELALALAADCRRGQPLQQLYLDAVSCVLASHLVRHYSQAPAASDVPTGGGLPKHLLRRSVEFIHTNLTRNLALGDIAQAAGLSPYHFSRLFKQSTGLGPHGYVMSVRVQRAKELLSDSERTIADVALDAGFADQSHFTDVFRKRTGTTPKRFRQMAAA